MINKFKKQIQILKDGQLNNNIFDLIEMCECDYLEDIEDLQSLIYYLDNYIFELDNAIDDISNFRDDLEKILDKCYKESDDE